MQLEKTRALTNTHTQGTNIMNHESTLLDGHIICSYPKITFIITLNIKCSLIFLLSSLRSNEQKPFRGEDKTAAHVAEDSGVT